MDKHKPPADDWVQELMRDFQDKLTCGLYDAIYKLEQGSVENLMRAQAHSCVGAFLELGTLRAPLSLDAFLDAMRIAGPSQVSIEREGNVIHWSEQHEGQCVCPFVRRGVVRLDPKLCVCGAHWVKELFRAVTGTEVDVEILDTAAGGAKNCSFLITVRGPAHALATH